MRRRTRVERPAGRIRLTGRAGVLGALLLILGTGTIVPLRAYSAQQQKVTALERHVDDMRQQNAELSTQAKRLRDPEYLARLARECLGMIEPGEIAFVTVPKTGTLPPPRC